MYRRTLARYRTGAALLLGLALRATSASAEPDETRVGTVGGEAAEELTSAAQTPPIPAAPIVSSHMRAELPSLYRIQLDSWMIHLGSIDRVDPYPGAYPARFGRFARGVFTAQRRGPEPTFSGEPSLRRFDVGGRIEDPFARGIGRLLPALLSLLGPEVKLDYRDNQSRRTYEPSTRDRFSAFGFGSYDPLSEKGTGLLSRLADACRAKITFTW
jgi:hypothetical protein